MDDAPPVCGGEPLGNLQGNREQRIELQRPAVDDALQRLALHVRITMKQPPENSPTSRMVQTLG